MTFQSQLELSDGAPIVEQKMAAYAVEFSANKYPNT